jgi:hypothetical protein
LVDQVDQAALLVDQVDQAKVLTEVMEALAMRAAQVDQAPLARLAGELSKMDSC